MPSIEVYVDSRCITTNEKGEYMVKVSKAENNGIHVTPNGSMTVDPTTTELKDNFSGNGIAGTPGAPLTRIECDSSVSRIQSATDETLKQHDGLYMPGLIQAILQSVNGGT